MEILERCGIRCRTNPQPQRPTVLGPQDDLLQMGDLCPNRNLPKVRSRVDTSFAQRYIHPQEEKPRTIYRGRMSFAYDPTSILTTGGKKTLRYEVPGPRMRDQTEEGEAKRQRGDQEEDVGETSVL